MKILHLSTSDRGGAGKAALRIHRALRQRQVDSKMLVGHRYSQDEHVHEMPFPAFGKRVVEYLNAFPRHFYPKRRTDLFSFDLFSYGNLTRHPLVNNADIIALYWVAGGFLPFAQLAGLGSKKLLWRLSDMWPFTGGCHYAEECTNYYTHCGQCKILNSKQQKDFSNFGWQKKKKLYDQLALTILAPSNWIANAARQSSLFANKRIEVLHTGVDTAIFYPRSKNALKEKYQLNKNKKTILFGAMAATEDKRKGFAYLQQSLAILKARAVQDVQLIVLGGEKNTHTEDLFESHYCAKIEDENILAEVYACADVVIVPSLQENLANVALEALASGVPVVAFKSGGMPDAIDHLNNGFLAEAANAVALAEGIEWALSQPEAGLREACRQKTLQQFCLNTQITKYLALCESLYGN